MKNKRGLSGVVITVLLLLLAIVIAGMIFAYSQGLLNTMKKSGVQTIANQECPRLYDFDYSACYYSSNSTINLEVINLKEDIPSGSLISLDFGPTKILTLLYQTPDKILKIGQSDSLVIDGQIIGLDFSNSIPLKIKIVPVFESNDVRVLCDNLNGVEITKC